MRLLTAIERKAALSDLLERLSYSFITAFNLGKNSALPAFSKNEYEYSYVKHSKKYDAQRELYDENISDCMKRRLSQP
jgi:hypothetical protein